MAAVDVPLGAAAAVVKTPGCALLVVGVAVAAAGAQVVDVVV
jgi:hypothetical protein